jgi:hypothetical protein
MHVRVDASRVRELAIMRIRAAWLVLVVAIVLAIAAPFVSPRLAIVTVLGAFFAFASASIIRRQRAIAADARDIELVLDGDELALGNDDPRGVVRAIVRPDYVRLMSTQSWVARLWLDDRRDPGAFVDVPMPDADRADLIAALERAAVPVHRQGRVMRVLALATALAVALTVWIAAKSVVWFVAVVAVTLPGFALIAKIVAVVHARLDRSIGKIAGDS